MMCIKADMGFCKAIYNVVQKTIKEVYPKYYPKGIVDFFCTLHCEDSIKQDISGGYLWALFNDENTLVGTGSCENNHITRVYVLPEYQGKGYGTFIIKKLEENIKEGYSEACLDASLPAAALYEKLGYKTYGHITYKVNDSAILVYEEMRKNLKN